MIVWLASYPRSGNTLLRILLRQVFDIRTYSLAGTKELSRFGSEVSELVGNMNTEWTADIENSARLTSTTSFVKTHEPHVQRLMPVSISSAMVGLPSFPITTA